MALAWDSGPSAPGCHPENPQSRGRKTQPRHASFEFQPKSGLTFFCVRQFRAEAPAMALPALASEKEVRTSSAPPAPPRAKAWRSVPLGDGMGWLAAQRYQSQVKDLQLESLDHCAGRGFPDDSASRLRRHRKEPCAPDRPGWGWESGDSGSSLSSVWLNKAFAESHTFPSNRLPRQSSERRCSPSATGVVIIIDSSSSGQKGG